MDQELDRPSHLTPHWARLGPGDGVRQARPTSTEGFLPGLHPYAPGFAPGGRSRGLNPVGSVAP